MTSAQDLIKKFEGCSLVPYLCPAGYWTIGYGHLCARTQSPITQAQADKLLEIDMYDAEIAVLVNTHPRFPNDGQYAALVSLVFNIGTLAFKGSTLRRRYLEGNDAAAAAEFGKWCHGGGRVLPGLVARRAAERAVFLSQK